MARCVNELRAFTNCRKKKRLVLKKFSASKHVIEEDNGCPVTHYDCSLVVD